MIKRKHKKSLIWDGIFWVMILYIFLYFMENLFENYFCVTIPDFVTVILCHAFMLVYLLVSIRNIQNRNTNTSLTEKVESSPKLKILNVILIYICIVIFCILGNYFFSIFIDVPRLDQLSMVSFPLVFVCLLFSKYLSVDSLNNDLHVSNKK